MKRPFFLTQDIALQVFNPIQDKAERPVKPLEKKDKVEERLLRFLRQINK